VAQVLWLHNCITNNSSDMHSSAERAGKRAPSVPMTWEVSAGSAGYAPAMDGLTSERLLDNCAAAAALTSSIWSA
jgi:hypothetical protein